jgi:circadian clock protein KaiC
MLRVRTGNPQLDSILHGGFPASSINIVAGAPGTGKTILAEQMVFANLPADRPVVYVTTLSEPLEKFITYLQELSFVDSTLIGSALVYEPIDPELLDAPEKLDEVLLDVLKRHRPQLLVIDSFKALADLMPSPRAWRQTLSRAAGVLGAYDVTTFLVGEYTPEALSNLPEFAVADGILELVREQTGTRDDRFLRVAKLRGSSFLDGYHAFRIGPGGLEVFPRLTTPAIPADYVPSEERVTSGVPGLDAMMEGGLLRGSSTLVLGPAGSGKSLLGLHFLREGTRLGEPGLLVALQENPRQIARTARRLGFQPDEILVPGKIDVFYRSPVELQVDTIVTEMYRRLSSQGARRVVIDAVNDLERSARDPLRFRDYVYTLYQHFTAAEVTALLLMETPMAQETWSTREPNISYMSDSVVLLGMDLAADLRRTARVVKSRGTAHRGQEHLLEITARGLVIGPA